MNKKQTIQARIESLSSLDLMKCIKRNCIKLNTHNLKKHEEMKFQICWALAKEGKEFITEAIFHNGKRADVIDLDSHIIIEILGTETEEECREKIKSYPKLFEVIMVDSNKEFSEKMIQ